MPTERHSRSLEAKSLRACQHPLLFPGPDEVSASTMRRWCLVAAAIGLFPEPWDKITHLLAFSALTGLLWTGTAGRIPLALIGIIAAIGALDEWHQAGLPGRSMDPADLLTDIAAAILTVAVLNARQKLAGKNGK
jgi:hypothetical protein